MRLRMKQRSSAPAKVYYDNLVLPLADLEKRKVVLQNSRSLADPEADELRMLVQLFADLTPYAHRGPVLIRDDLSPSLSAAWLSVSRT